MGKPKKYYAVARGRNPGIFTAWFGPGGAEAQIRRYPGARYKGFPSLAEAREWMENQRLAAASSKKEKAKKEQPGKALDIPGDAQGRILVYTDGGRPGPPPPPPRGRGGTARSSLKGKSEPNWPEGSG
jgi:ribonuclease HI